MDAVIPQQRVAVVPAEVAVRRLPSSFSSGGVGVDVDRARPGPGTSSSGARRFPASWRARRRSGTGYVEIGPLSGDMSVVEVALPPRVAHRHAEVLRDQLERRPEPAAGPWADASAPPPRRPVTVAAGLAVALAAVLGAGSAALSRPSPVTTETAVARYREAAGTAAEGAPGAVPSPVGDLPPSQPANAAAPPAARDTGERPPDPTEAAAPPVPLAPGGGPTATGEEAGPPSTAAAPGAPAAPAAPPEPSPAATGGAEEASAPASQSAQAPPEPHSAPPEPGVYRYETSGWEELSTPGSRRTFPGETAQSVVHTECGFTTTWQPFEERRDVFDLCIREGGTVLAAAESYRAFYGYGREQRFTCADAPVPQGATWAVRCTDEPGTTVMHVTARRQGEEVVDVAGRPVATRKVAIDTRMEGDTNGTRSAVSWRDEDGLLVRTEVTSDLEVAGPTGRVRYREQHRLQLVDPTPHR